MAPRTAALPPSIAPIARFALRVATLTLCLVTVALSGSAQTLDSVSPASQRVNDLVTLRGSGFGTWDAGVTAIVFTGAGGTTVAGAPYVWRDELIQVRVPVGGATGPIDKGPLEISVVTAVGTTNSVAFQVLTRTGELSFVERTMLIGGFDQTEFLGDPALNIARTKDAEVGDVNGDGWPDLIDNNSNNVGNGTHEVLRINTGGTGFTGVEWEPVGPNDSGEFATEVPPGGDFVGDAIVYDADFVDLNNDELPDWVQAASASPSRVRVLINGHNGQPGSFLESSSTWFPSHTFVSSPDDVAHGDLNYDGFVDVAVAFRFNRFAEVYLNQAGQQFGAAIRVSSPQNSSVHDVFLGDVDNDGLADVLVGDESGTAASFLNTGGPNPQFVFDQAFNFTAVAGIAADFNADGVDDIALANLSSARVLLNDPLNPGNFTIVQLPNVPINVYDLEPGDIDLDGDVDLVGPAVIFNGNADDTVRVWLNNGDGTFVNATSPGASDLLPGIGPWQRLSADLIDFDLDGDLDLYLTGADGTGIIGFGQVANQFWENLLPLAEPGLDLTLTGSCPAGVTFAVTGATPNGRLALYTGAAAGTDPLVGGPCNGTPSGLAAPTLRFRARADANGTLTFDRGLPPSTCSFLWQAVDITTCETSGVEVTP